MAMAGDAPHTRAENSWVLLAYALIASFFLLNVILLMQGKWFQFWEIFF